MLEDEITQLIRIEAAKHGIILWRNNSGVLIAKDGRPVRFGLCNESNLINNDFKSSDLIGITNSGTFIATEVKKEGWKFAGTEREFAQQNFINFIKRKNGIAGFCNSVEQFKELIGK
jgi:hypothetical protein